MLTCPKPHTISAFPSALQALDQETARCHGDRVLIDTHLKQNNRETNFLIGPILGVQVKRTFLKGSEVQ